MIRQSNYRQSLVRALMELIPSAQNATDAVDEAAACQLRVNRTDLRCLGAVLRSQGISASKLAQEVGLTRGAMTTALDRLERTRHVRRTEDPKDGRGVRVDATAAAARAVQQIWGPIEVEALKLLEKYSDSELEAIRRFFDEYCRFQRLHAERIRGLSKQRHRDGTKAPGERRRERRRG
jgi:DNA-binding MarR family transcriptional regulator